jgi:hypothetical protein
VNNPPPPANGAVNAPIEPPSAPRPVFAPTAPGHVSQPLTIIVTAPGKPVAGITVTVSGKGT